MCRTKIFPMDHSMSMIYLGFQFSSHLLTPLLTFVQLFFFFFCFKPSYDSFEWRRCSLKWEMGRKISDGRMYQSKVWKLVWFWQMVCGFVNLQFRILHELACHSSSVSKMYYLLIVSKVVPLFEDNVTSPIIHTA